MKEDWAQPNPTALLEETDPPLPDTESLLSDLGVHDGGPVEPRPVSGAGHVLDARVAAQCGAEAVCEVRSQVRVVVSPDDERGSGELAQSSRDRRELLWVGVPVELQDRALGAGVEVLVDVCG